jgi:Lhr-like helicase
VRAELLGNRPHILLTNYVMLEYMLLRPQERALVGETTRALKFLAVDELHVYRGRQGADVAMLLRRLRQRVGRQDPQCAGTSASIATEGDRATRRARIAEVGSRLFGVPLSPANVIDETLQRVATAPVPTSAEAMRAATTKKASPGISHSSETGCGPTRRIFPTIGSILVPATSGSVNRFADLGRSLFSLTALSARQGCQALSKVGGSRVR